MAWHEDLGGPLHEKLAQSELHGPQLYPPTFSKCTVAREVWNDVAYLKTATLRPVRHTANEGDQVTRFERLAYKFVSARLLTRYAGTSESAIRNQNYWQVSGGRKSIDRTAEFDFLFAMKGDNDSIRFFESQIFPKAVAWLDCMGSNVLGAQFRAELIGETVSIVDNEQLKHRVGFTTSAIVPPQGYEVVIQAGGLEDRLTPALPPR